MKKLFQISGLTYLFLYMFPFPIVSYYREALEPVIFFIAKGLFDIKTLTHEYKGSGDSIYDYARIGVLLIISFVLAVLSLITFRNRIKLEFIRKATLVYAQYYLGFFMLTYGFSKIFDGGQFFFTTPYVKLEQTIGNSSPMGLLWTLMGVSRPYATFGGILEIIAGYLLLFRRTKTVGSLLTIIIMTNIVLMNFCYDVPVKLFSFHLLLISIVLLVPDLRSMYAFFILRQASQLPSIQQKNNKYKTVGKIGQGIAIIGLTILGISPYMSISLSQKSRIDGMYSADLFVVENDTLAPVLSDSVRWKNLIISGGLSRVTYMTDSIEKFKVTVDTVSKTIILTTKNESNNKYSLKYSENKGKFNLYGLWKGRTITAVFSKKGYNDYRLTNRGFHLISESQYNY